MKGSAPNLQNKWQDHDACGIGAVVNIDGHRDHRVLDDALHIVEKLEHRAGKDAIIHKFKKRFFIIYL